jgi:hypothetical protein
MDGTSDSSGSEKKGVPVADGDGVDVATGGSAVWVETGRIAASVSEGLAPFESQPILINKTTTREMKILSFAIKNLAHHLRLNHYLPNPADICTNGLICGA